MGVQRVEAKLKELESNCIAKDSFREFAKSIAKEFTRMKKEIKSLKKGVEEVEK